MTGDKRRKRPAPLSIRLSESERGSLKRRAGNQPIGAYVKAALFAGDGGLPARPTRAVSVDHALLGQVLAQLGASGLASSLAVLARHAESGNLFEDEITTSRLRAACSDVRAMRDALMRALGKREDRP